MAEPLVAADNLRGNPEPWLAPPVDLAQVIERLSQLGPPSEVRSGTPPLVAELLDLDRVILSSVAQGQLIVVALHSSAANKQSDLLEALQANPATLGYPLIEGEIMRRRRPRVVTAGADDSPSRYAFADTLGWTEYVAAPILLDGSVIGFLHADRLASERNLDESDARALAAFTLCLGVVYDRAVLRQRLRVQRRELRQIATWADARTSELDLQAATLHDNLGDTDKEGRGAPAFNNSALGDLLTRRELEVLKLMVNGETNAGIARSLVVSEGTVKFHVKNILRKMHATNRADATARYVRLTLKHGERNG